MEQIAFIEPSSPVPPGNTASWFTDLGHFLELERQLLAERLIPRRFDLDPSGHNEAPVSCLIRERGGLVFTVAENGLAQTWQERVVFLNPDYQAEEIDRFLAVLADPELGRRMHGRVAHLPAWTDRGWYHRHIEPGRRRGRIDVRFLEGRQHYGWPGNPKGLGGDSAKFPSMDVIWRPS